MKKIVLLIATVAMVYAFSSCTKEGAFSPKEKISKVYYSESMAYSSSELSNYNWQLDKYLGENWTWTDKTLTRIDEYDDDGDLYSTRTFVYDKKNRIDRIIYSGSQAQFKYEGSTLTGIEVYSGATLVSTYNFTHEKGKIVKIENNDYASPKSSESINPLEFVLSKQMVESIERVIEKAPKTRGLSTKIYTLTWNGKNVEKMNLEYGSYFVNATYTYDTYQNPYYGLYEGVDVASISTNNITSINYTESYGTETYMEMDEYTYTYEGKFPVTSTYSYTDKDLDNDQYTYTSITYYEYE